MTIGWLSASLRHFEESGLSRVDHGVEAIPSLQPLVYRSHRLVGKRSNIEVFAYAPRIHGRREHRGTALDAPGKKHLCRSPSRVTRDGDDEWIIEQSRFQGMPQRGKGQQHDVLRFA